MITKEEFEKAYKKFPPQRCELFFLKYISLHSLYENKLFIFLTIIILLLPFLVGLIFKLLHYSWALIHIPTFLYCIILSAFGIYWLIIWNKKRKRILKLRKYLNLSKKEYNEVVKIYFYHRYSNAEKYIKYNSK